MKNLMIISIFFSLMLTSCGKDMDDISSSSAEVNQLYSIIRAGEWQISEYVYNGDEFTSNYSGYSFNFEENNNLIASSGSELVSGSWRIGNDAGSDFDSYNDVDFIIFFTPGAKFQELSHSYDVISASEKKIVLNLEANAEDNTAVLIFSRN